MACFLKLRIRNVYLHRHHFQGGPILLILVFYSDHQQSNLCLSYLFFLSKNQRLHGCMHVHCKFVESTFKESTERCLMKSHHLIATDISHIVPLILNFPLTHLIYF